jgi:hypothetical protein
MVRKQVYITEEQDTRLKRLASAQGLTEAELVRMALDGLTEVTYAPGAGGRHGRVRETAVKEYAVDTNIDIEAFMARADFTRTLRRKLDEDAWLEELALIRNRAKTVAGSTEKFRREDAYDDERRFRLSR